MREENRARIHHRRHSLLFLHLHIAPFPICLSFHPFSAFFCSYVFILQLMIKKKIIPNRNQDILTNIMKLLSIADSIRTNIRPVKSLLSD